MLFKASKTIFLLFLSTWRWSNQAILVLEIQVCIDIHSNDQKRSKIEILSPHPPFGEFENLLLSPYQTRARFFQIDLTRSIFTFIALHWSAQLYVTLHCLAWRWFTVFFYENMIYVSNVQRCITQLCIAARAWELYLKICVKKGAGFSAHVQNTKIWMKYTNIDTIYNCIVCDKIECV